MFCPEQKELKPSGSMRSSSSCGHSSKQQTRTLTRASFAVVWLSFFIAFYFTHCWCACTRQMLKACYSQHGIDFKPWSFVETRHLKNIEQPPLENMSEGLYWKVCGELHCISPHNYGHVSNHLPVSLNKRRVVRKSDFQKSESKFHMCLHADPS